MENRATMALINYRLFLLSLILGFTCPTLADQGFYITGKKLYYNHESGTPIARKTERPYQGYSNILFERQQKATNHVSKGEGGQGGIGYTFAKPYHVELSYFTYGKTFKQKTSESPFNNTSGHDTYLPDPNQQYIFSHTTRGLMLVGQRNLFQLHRRITLYGGGGIAFLGQYSQDNDDSNDTLASPISLWSLLSQKAHASNHTVQNDRQQMPIDRLTKQEQQEWQQLSGATRHALGDIPMEEGASTMLQTPIEKWSLSLIAKLGVLFHITNRFTIDVSYSITFKKYHLLNIDKIGICQSVQPTLDADTLNFWQVGFNYKL